MKVEQVLHMNGGEGEASYAQNALIPKKALIMTKGIREEAIERMHSLLATTKSVAIADLGCSSGPNTFVAIGEVLKAIYKSKKDPELYIQVFLNDLHGNDFNTIFKALPDFEEQLRHEIGDRFGRCFFHGVPGSFYHPLFHPNTLHFLHSSYSLHFLSQVPKEVGRSHKNNICLSSESPASVVKAYYEQFQTDFTSFLRYRSEELVKDGCMVVTLLGRSDDPSVRGSGYIWDPLATVLNQMVTEGLIKEETLDMFNIPMYTPSPEEIEMEVNKEGSFEINNLQVSELEWEAANITDEKSSVVNDGLIKCMRSVAEPMLSDHFGQELMDQVFTRYGVALAECMAKEKTFFTNITISLIKSM